VFPHLEVCYHLNGFCCQPEKVSKIKWPNPGTGPKNHRDFEQFTMSELPELPLGVAGLLVGCFGQPPDSAEFVVREVKRNGTRFLVQNGDSSEMCLILGL